MIDAQFSFRNSDDIANDVQQPPAGSAAARRPASPPPLPSGMMGALPGTASRRVEIDLVSCPISPAPPNWSFVCRIVTEFLKGNLDTDDRRTAPLWEEMRRGLNIGALTPPPLRYALPHRWCSNPRPPTPLHPGRSNSHPRYSTPRCLPMLQLPSRQNGRQQPTV